MQKFSNFNVPKRPALSSTVHSPFYPFHWSIPSLGERGNAFTLKIGTGMGNEKWGNETVTHSRCTK